MSLPRLLLVDDEPAVALILGRVARRAGVDFASCKEAQSAVAAFRSSRPDLGLLDVNLPGMSGIALLRALREDESLRDSRIALFCHSGMRADIAEGWEAGADYLVCKDLLATPAALQQRLTEILAHGDGRSPLPSVTSTSRDERLTCNRSILLDPSLLLSAGQLLGDEVLGRVLRRAFAQGFATDSWLVPDTTRLDPEKVPATVARISLSRLFASLADQFWCLLGTDASAALVDRLRELHDRHVG